MTLAVTRMFATSLPGLGPVVCRQLDQRPGITVTGRGFDGRADVVTFEAGRGYRASAARVRTTEDVFAEIGRADRANGDNPFRIAAALWQPQRVERALSIWTEPSWSEPSWTEPSWTEPGWSESDRTEPIGAGPIRARPTSAGLRRRLAGPMTFRVVSRVLSEQAFRRTDLRAAVARVVGQDRRKWAIADPAQLEIWACEYRPGRFICGLRLSDSALRQHGGRTLERYGSLRPALAAALVAEAGKPAGILLDPCCGSGTILAEAIAADWTAAGTDIAPDAVAAARANVPSATVALGDALHLDHEDASVAAFVSNPPYGRQHRLEADMSTWLAGLLREAARVLAPGGCAVLLTPVGAASLAPASLVPAGHVGVSLLGVRTTIWCFRRLDRLQVTGRDGEGRAPVPYQGHKRGNGAVRRGGRSTAAAASAATPFPS